MGWSGGCSCYCRAVESSGLCTKWFTENGIFYIGVSNSARRPCGGILFVCFYWSLHWVRPKALTGGPQGRLSSPPNHKMERRSSLCALNYTPQHPLSHTYSLTTLPSAHKKIKQRQRRKPFSNAVPVESSKSALHCCNSWQAQCGSPIPAVCQSWCYSMTVSSSLGICPPNLPLCTPHMTGPSYDPWKHCGFAPITSVGRCNSGLHAPSCLYLLPCPWGVGDPP